MDEKAVVKKPAGEVVRESQPETRIYEVIVKFHKDGKPMIEAFLIANMTTVSIAMTQDSNILLAYCSFEGDIKALDDKLSALRQGAMVVLGNKEEKFLDFFVALRQLSQPLPDLLSSGRSNISPSSFASFVKPDWVKGFMVALGLFIVWQGYLFFSAFVSRVLNPPPISSAAPNPIVSEWAPYVLPEYHQTWLNVKKKHGMSDEMMVSLFRAIKQIDRYGAGHTLRDLTVYPQAIDRALGVIILKNVTDTEALRTLHKTLEGYSAQWRSLPDNPVKQRGLSLSSDMFNDQIVLTFYEQLLDKPRREFTERLIRELRQAHLSG